MLSACITNTHTHTGTIFFSCYLPFTFHFILHLLLAIPFLPCSDAVAALLVVFHRKANARTWVCVAAVSLTCRVQDSLLLIQHYNNNNTSSSTSSSGTQRESGALFIIQFKIIQQRSQWSKELTFSNKIQDRRYNKYFGCGCACDGNVMMK